MHTPQDHLEEIAKIREERKKAEFNELKTLVPHLERIIKKQVNEIDALETENRRLRRLIHERHVEDSSLTTFREIQGMWGQNKEQP